MVDNNEIFAFINTHPVVQSLLYDLDLLPEQLKEGTKDWQRMYCIVEHFKYAIENPYDTFRSELDVKN